MKELRRSPALVLMQMLSCSDRIPAQGIKQQTIYLSSPKKIVVDLPPIMQKIILETNKKHFEDLSLNPFEG